MHDPSTSSHVPETYFAPAGRDTPEDFARKVEIVRNSPLLNAFLNAIPGRTRMPNPDRGRLGPRRHGFAGSRHAD